MTNGHDNGNPATGCGADSRGDHPGARKSNLYGLLGWPEYFSGYDYDYSRKWSYCLHSEEQDAVMSHARCTRGVDIYFGAPNYARVTAVKLTSGDSL
jgi:hypothetical protein